MRVNFLRQIDAAKIDWMTHFSLIIDNVYSPAIMLQLAGFYLGLGQCFLFPMYGIKNILSCAWEIQPVAPRLPVGGIWRLPELRAYPRPQGLSH